MDVDRDLAFENELFWEVIPPNERPLSHYREMINLGDERPHKSKSAHMKLVSHASSKLCGRAFKVKTDMKECNFPLMMVDFETNSLSTLTGRDVLTMCQKVFELETSQCFLYKGDQIIPPSQPIGELLDQAKTEPLIFQCCLTDAAKAAIQKTLMHRKAFLEFQKQLADRVTSISKKWLPVLKKVFNVTVNETQFLFEDGLPSVSSLKSYTRALLEGQLDVMIGQTFLDHIHPGNVESRGRLRLEVKKRDKRQWLEDKLKSSPKAAEAFQKMENLDISVDKFAMEYADIEVMVANFSTYFEALAKDLPRFHPDRLYLLAASQVAANLVSREEFDKLSFLAQSGSFSFDSGYLTGERCLGKQKCVQRLWICKTCNLNIPICEACARSCHAGHVLDAGRVVFGYCACSKTGHCRYRQLAIMDRVRNEIKGWVCVIEPGQKNRVFQADQIQDLTAKELLDILGVEKDYYLAVLLHHRRQRLNPDSVVLQEYSDIVLNHRPEAYHRVKTGIVIVPRTDFTDIVFYFHVRLSAEMTLTGLPISVKQCEVSSLSMGEMLSRCVQTLAMPLKNASILVDGTPVGPSQLLSSFPTNAQFELQCDMMPKEAAKYRERCSVVELFLAKEQELVCSMVSLVKKLSEPQFSEIGAGYIPVIDVGRVLHGDRLEYARYKVKPRKGESQHARLWGTNIGMLFMSQDCLDDDFNSVVAVMALENALESVKVRDKNAIQNDIDVIRDCYRSKKKNSYCAVFRLLDEVTPSWHPDKPFLQSVVEGLEALSNRIEAFNISSPTRF